MSAPELAHQLVTCSDCGAAGPAAARKCWLCGAAIDPAAARQVEPRASRTLPKRRAPQPITQGQGLALSALAVAVVVVGFGVTLAAPGLGILYAVILAPALVRTFVAAQQETVAGATGPGKLAAFGQSLAISALAFAGSLGVIVVTLAAGLMACFAICMGALASDAFGVNKAEEQIMNVLFACLGFALVGGAIAAVGVFFYIFWKLWPRAN